ncbi:hypothetical protein GGS21DRAFT_441236 [Xylaria nigripes]|nr:hypothetical protein GGS21DRAFT_441236 [Xylaria nigripes]
MLRLFRPRRKILALAPRVSKETVQGQKYPYWDDDDMEMTEQERQELEELEASPTFIPFPGFTRMVDSKPYRGSDPEWQAYLKVNKDLTLQRSIREELAELARRGITNHPDFTKRLGTGGYVSHYWFEMFYPPKPPATFVRQGLSIGGGDGIKWAEHNVDPHAVFWARQALWPSALASSLWAFTSALVSQNAMTIAKFLGYENHQKEHVPNLQQTIEKIQLQLKKPPPKPGSISPPLPSQEQTGDGSANSSLPPVDKTSAGSTTTPETVGSGGPVDNAVSTTPRARDLPMIRATREHTDGPWSKFKQSLAQKWRRPITHPPRGSILLYGPVEVITERAVVSIDCSAWWDPQSEAFDLGTINFKVRMIRPKQQAPLR